jgi:ferredoxin
MTPVQLEKFTNYLLKEKWAIFGPVRPTNEKVADTDDEKISPYLTAHGANLPKPKTGEIFIEKIEKAHDLLLSDKLPFYSFKRFFLPESEILFEYKNNKLDDEQPIQKIALMGVNILDLKAVNLYDQVFEKDQYYQKRRREILIIGYWETPQIGDPLTRLEQDNIFGYQFEEDILEHLPFDIFLMSIGEKAHFKVFTGSIKGQRILEHFGYKDYEHVQFSGPVKEGKVDERMLKLKDKLENKHNQKIWEDLGKRCLECGKCTLACPTCFCFRIDDSPGLNAKSGQRNRCWDSCYFQEFSEVATNHKFLNSTAKRIHFWYYHKFARIPKEFDFMGCVGCRRCAKVCPVGIDIAKVLEDIENS